MRLLGWTVMGLVALVLGMQVVPYGRDHTNPPARVEPPWDRAETRAMAVRACYDCHSNQTVWRWYTSVAPVSWLVQRDVVEGRKAVNFSEWDRPQEEARDSAETVRKGEMPPWYYSLVRAEARLSAAEREALMRGLETTLNRGRNEHAGEKGERRRHRER
jgi:hypothetical protein